MNGLVKVRSIQKCALLILLSPALISFPRAYLLRLEPGPAGPTGSPQPQNPKIKGADSKPRKPAARVRPLAAQPQSQSVVLRELSILPSSISLTGSRSSQRVVVEGLFEDGHQEDLTSRVELSSSNRQVAVVEGGTLVRPTGDGEATIRASLSGREARAPLQVKAFAALFVWSFRNHVLPVMTKMGCNSGACHGAAAGKNGFKLTLRGYGPEVDYATLTRQALGRRTVRLEPAKSLILLKPTLTIPHGGGRRFSVGSREYQVISGWIAAGMPPPKDTDPRIQSLEVLPREVPLLLGAEQQLLVRARFSDGHMEDVTTWAKYTSGDDSVASVDDDGRVKMRGHGEVPVTVWYLNRVSLGWVSVPFPNAVDEDVFRSAPRKNYIDDLVLKKLHALRIPPSSPATDEEFLRRAYLDAAGILPTPAEAEKFLANRSGDKRARLIEQLLSRPEFVDYWAYKWSDLLLVSSQKLSPLAMRSYYNWIRDNVKSNKPWDQSIREIITASGSNTENGAANYYVIHRDPIDIAENAAQAFLGLSIKCAHCHNHPMERWTQSDYYAMANLFSRVRVKDSGSSPRFGTLVGFTVFSGSMGEVNHPRLGRPLPPQPLDGHPLPLDSSEDRRAYFAQWLTSPRNPYFARALVNRVWRNFMGRGLVEPADDLRETNPPANKELLDALVEDFVGHGFDVKHLIRTIMNSATYQTTSDSNAQNAQDEKYYSHYVIRRLAAEVLLDTISQVTQVPEKFEGYPPGTRALQLPDTKVDSFFLTTFGRPARLQTSESERQTEPSVTQVLHLINGETLNGKLRAAGGTVDMLVKLGLTNDQVVEYLYLAAFSRYPTAAERRRPLDDLEKANAKQRLNWDAAEARRRVFQDLLWAMLTSKEFIFDY